MGLRRCDILCPAHGLGSKAGLPKAAAAQVAPAQNSQPARRATPPPQVIVYSQNLIQIGYPELGDIAKQIGFDWLELHYAHGYLMSAFITPLTNKRTDDYGGSLNNRMRFPLEVFHVRLAQAFQPR